MEFYGFDRNAALGHCDGGQASLERDLDRVRGWNRLGPAHVIQLLATAVPAARRDARNVAAQICRSAWRIHMDAATAGKAQQGSTRELKITAGGRNYRLSISEGVRLRLEEIVQSA